MSDEERIKRLERLVIELWDDYQCEQDCRVCAFWRDDPDNGVYDECEVENELESLGLRRKVR